MMRLVVINGKTTLATVCGALCFAGLILPARACELVITWKAALTGSQPAPMVQTPATGTAAIQFDFVHPGATVQVDTKNLQDVRSIELHVARSYTDHAGPAVVALYSSTDGPLPAALTRRITEADLLKQTRPKIAAFADLVQAVLNGRAYVTVATKSHPEGELSGFITMHKEAIYSDNPGDIAHDPALHHSTATVNGTVSH